MDNVYEVTVTATFKTLVRAGSKQSASRQVREALDMGIISFAEDGDVRLDFVLLQGSEPKRRPRVAAPAEEGGRA